MQRKKFGDHEAADPELTEEFRRELEGSEGAPEGEKTGPGTKSPLRASGKNLTNPFRASGKMHGG